MYILSLIDIMESKLRFVNHKKQRQNTSKTHAKIMLLLKVTYRLGVSREN